jgi:GNAT superfamily N-acetyltransferase
MKNISKGAFKETAKTVAKGTGVQAGLGAAGEAVSSVAIGKPIDPGEVLSEAAGEIFSAPGEAVSTYRSQNVPKAITPTDPGVVTPAAPVAVVSIAPEAPVTPASPVAPDMMADLASIRTEPIELPPVAKAATTVAPEAATTPQAQAFENIEKPKFVQDETGEKLSYPMFVDMANKGYQLYSFENPRTYVNKGGNPYRTLEKEGVRIALEPQQVLFTDPKYPNRQPQLGMGNEKDVAFHFLGVDPEIRKQGKARAALQDLIDVADQNGYTLYGEPAQLEKEGMTVKDLNNLYSQYGFKQSDESGKVIVRDPTAITEEQSFESIQPKYIVPSSFAPQLERSPSFRMEMKRLNKMFKAGRISPEIMARQTDVLLDQTKKEKVVAPRLRGANIILERLNAAARRGELSQEGVDLASWLISKNPNLVEDLAISIRKPGETTPSGRYDPLRRLVTLFKESGASDTAVHEILHHLERMMPENVQNALRKLWYKRFLQVAKKADNGTDENLKKYLQNVLDYHVDNNTKAGNAAKELISSGAVDISNYQYFSPSEFWAVNASDIVAGRYEGDKSFLAKLKQWLKEFGSKIKGMFGLTSDAPIISALDSLYKADGKYQSSAMLTPSTTFENIEPPKKVKTERKNYKGDPAPLATWALEADNRYITDDFIYKMQDRLIDTKRVMQAIKKQVGDISVKWDTYKREILYHGRASDAIKKFLRYDVQSLIQSIDQAGLTMPEVKDYLHNRHAQERNETVAKINPTMPDGGSGIMTADAQKYLKNLSKEKRQKLEAVGKKVDEIIRKTQKILVDTGQEPKETIDSYNKAYKYYVPLFREELDYIDTGARGTGQGFSVRGGFSKRAMGSTKPVEDILSNIITSYERAVGRGEKNLVLQSLYGLAIQNPNPDLWMPINPDAPSSTKQAKEELLRMGISPTDVENLMREPMESYIDPKTGLVGQRLKQSIRDSNYALPLRIEGKQRFLVLNPNNEEAKRMVLALKNMDLRDLHAAFNFFSKFTRWFVGVNTQYNPLFGMVNFIRDVQGSAVNLSTTPLAGKQAEVMPLAIKNLRGVYQALRAETMGEAITTDVGREFADMQSHGGQTGYRDSYQQKTEQHKIIEDTLAKMEAGPARKGLMYSLEFLSDVNDAMENATRLAVYQTSLKYAKNKDEAAKDEAAILAKTISVNFNKRGAWTQEASALYGFFNSSVQGTTRTLETLRGPAGKKIIAGGITLGIIQALALTMAGFDDDQPPPFVRDKNIVIPIPGTDKKYLTWPMPLGLNILPNIGRTITEIMLGGGKNAGKKLAHLFVAVLDSFNPFGSSESVAQLISPTFADPIIALAENKDAFGRPIYKKDKDTAPTPGYTRAKDTASTFSKEVSEFLNWVTLGDKDKKGGFSPTPDQIDYVIGQVTGGIGRELMKIDQSLRSLGTGEELPPYKIPIAGRFYGDAASQAAQSGKFYDSVTKLSQFENQIKGRMERGESYSSILRDNPEARLWRKANSVENEISALNKKKRDLVEKDAPKDQIKRIEEIKKRKMQQFNQEYERAVK